MPIIIGDNLDGSEVIPVIKGGTGAPTKDGAIVNLDMVKRSELLDSEGKIKNEFIGDTGASVILVNEDGLIPPERFNSGSSVQNNIEGPTTVFGGTTHTYKITDFNDFSNYVVTLDKGTITRSGDTLTAVFSPSAVGTAKITVNGSQFVVTITPVTLSGPTTGYSGTVLTYTIVNYDSNVTYEVSASVGTFTRNGSTITVTLPVVASGTLTLTVNGTTYTTSITQGGVNKPSIITPTQGSTNVTPDFTFTSSPFSTTPNNWTTHANSDWQVATDSNFTNVVKSVSASSTSKVSFSVTAMTPNQVHYVRVRYRGSNGFVTEWSDTVMFTVRRPLTVITSYIDTDPLDEGFAMGYDIDMSADGTVLAVSGTAPPVGQYDFYNRGVVNMYVKIDGVWTKTQRIYRDTGGFGYNIKLSRNGEILLVFSPRYPYTAGTESRLYIYKRNGNTWTQIQVLTSGYRHLEPLVIRNHDLISVSGDGLMIPWNGIYTVQGVPRAEYNRLFIYSIPESGYIWSTDRLLQSLHVNNDASYLLHGWSLFKKQPQSNVWTSVSTLNLSQPYPIVTIGGSTGEVVVSDISSLASNSNFDLFVAGAPGAYGRNGWDGSGSGNGRGAIVIFRRVGDTLQYETCIMNGEVTFAGGFGANVAMSGDGKRIMVSAPQANQAGANSGLVFVYENINNVWTMVKKLLPTDVKAGENFGSSLAMDESGTTAAIGVMNRLNMGGNRVGGVYLLE